MIHAGMIFQYNSDNETGLIMFSDGSQKTFSSDDWVDMINTPAIGQKIVYTETVDVIEIRVASEDDLSNIPLNKEKSKSVDEHIEHFVSIGFKLVKETLNNEVQTVILRTFQTGEPQEVIITNQGSKITIIETINGKIVS